MKIKRTVTGLKENIVSEARIALEYIKINNAVKGLFMIAGKDIAEKVRPENFPKIETTQSDWNFYKKQFQIAVEQMEIQEDERTRISLAGSFIKIANYLQNLEIKEIN